MKFITLIFDIKNSREIENRNDIQILLIKTLKKCNLKFKDIIVSPFIITLGDEWEGLLKDNSDYAGIIKFFRDNLPSSIEFYTGIGIGDVTVHDFELTVNQLDGPSFHLARKAIKYAKRNNCSLVILAS